MRDCLARIEAREPDGAGLGDDSIRSSRSRRRARSITGRARGPLHGVPIGVKDIIDTVDLPTEMGSPIYRGHRPPATPPASRCVRAAGAVILGKTVTAEFAGMAPGPTTNPHNRSAYARRLVERIGRGGGRPHGAGRVRHPDRRLGAAAGRPIAA